MKRILSITFAAGLLLTVIGCKEECAACTVTQTLSENGVVIVNQTLKLDQEYCGDALDAIMETEGTTTQGIPGFELVTDVRVNCQ